MDDRFDIGELVRAICVSEVLAKVEIDGEPTFFALPILKVRHDANGINVVVEIPDEIRRNNANHNP